MTNQNRHPGDEVALARDRRGAVAVEYIVVVGTVAILAIPAALIAGSDLVSSFAVARELLFLPIP
jgi:Flp pilus assembly pilin Flp